MTPLTDVSDDGPAAGVCANCWQTFIAKSDVVGVSRCTCGHYWLHGGGEVARAGEMEQALAEIIDALIRLKLPGAVPEGRRSAGSRHIIGTQWATTVLGERGMHDEAD